MKKPVIISIFSIVALLGGMIPAAQAQVYGYNPAPVYTGAPACLSLTSYLSLGSTDAYTGGQVTVLQQFLNQTGYLSGVSGTFDTGTYGAVINFQNAHGIPGTGTVGPETRAAINAQSCGGSAYTGGYTGGGANGCSWSGSTYVCGFNNYPVGINNYYPSTPNYCRTTYNGFASQGYSNCGYYNYVHINSLSNSYGYNGQTITISGTGFSSTGNTVHFGNYTINNVPSYNGTTLTFTVPINCTAGNYSVTVTNAAGMTSNSLPFQTGNYNNFYPYGNNCYNGTFNNCNYPYNNGNNTVSLSNISGPSNVQVGTTNTWSVTAYNSNNYYSNGQTTISVNWGDNYGNNANDTRTFYTNGSQSFSFTHTYMYPGTYTIRMTATNSNGYTSYQTYTVYVNGYGYYNY